MSMKIYDAWRIPTQDMSELVDFANDVKEAQRKSYLPYIASRASGVLLWSADAAKAIALQGVSFEDFAKEMAGPMFRAGGMMLCEDIITVPEDVSAYLQESAQNACKALGLNLSDKEQHYLLLTLKDILEAIQGEQQKLFFLRGDNGYTYMKAMGLTNESRKFIAAKYQSFEYWDNTEMELDDFDDPELATACEGKSEEEQNELLFSAQSSRGTLWDKAFGSHSKWGEAALSFSIAPVFTRAIMAKVIEATLKLAAQANSKGRRMGS